MQPGTRPPGRDDTRLPQDFTELVNNGTLPVGTHRHLKGVRQPAQEILHIRTGLHGNPLAQAVNHCRQGRGIRRKLCLHHSRRRVTGNPGSPGRRCRGRMLRRRRGGALQVRHRTIIVTCPK